MEGLPKPGKYISKDSGNELIVSLLDDSQDYVFVDIFEDDMASGGPYSVKELNEMLVEDNYEWLEDAPEEDDIEQQPFIRESKIGRNEPCPCGSGKKYKRCCG